jgi:hypothetical protein
VIVHDDEEGGAGLSSPYISRAWNLCKAQFQKSSKRRSSVKPLIRPAKKNANSDDKEVQFKVQLQHKCVNVCLSLSRVFCAGRAVRYETSLVSG